MQVEVMKEGREEKIKKIGRREEGRTSYEELRRGTQGQTDKN